MTLQEARIFRQTGVASPSASAGVPDSPSLVIPVQVNSVNTIERPAPLTENSFNRVPLDDVALFREFKHSHPLHRADGLAAHWKRGEQLNSYLRENGASKFAHAYD